MRRLLLALVAAFIGPVPASACIWDSELPGHEREFRSSYDRQAKRDEPSATVKYLPWAAAGVGAVLLTVGCVVVFRGSKRG